MKLENFTGLEKAIKDFNNWGHSATLYVNLEEGYFNTEVFPNDVAKSENVFADGVYGVMGKSDRDNNRNIGEKRKAYILDYTQLLLEGYEPASAEYQLMEKHRTLFM